MKVTEIKKLFAEHDGILAVAIRSPNSTRSYAYKAYVIEPKWHGPYRNYYTHTACSGVAIARPEFDNWQPDVVQPAQVACLWSEYEAAEDSERAERESRFLVEVARIKRCETLRTELEAKLIAETSITLTVEEVIFLRSLL